MSVPTNPPAPSEEEIRSNQQLRPAPSAEQISLVLACLADVRDYILGHHVVLPTFGLWPWIALLWLYRIWHSILITPDSVWEDAQ